MSTGDTGAIHCWSPVSGVPRITRVEKPYFFFIFYFICLGFYRQMKNYPLSHFFCLPFCYLDKGHRLLCINRMLKAVTRSSICNGGICEATDKQSSGKHVDHVCQLWNTVFPWLTEIGTVASRTDKVQNNTQRKRLGSFLEAQRWTNCILKC